MNKNIIVLGISLLLLVGFSIVKSILSNKTIKKKSSRLIVIDGIDGSGKATQAKILVDALKRINDEFELGYKIFHLEFPNYENLSSTLVKKYLEGNYNSDMYQSSLFYTADRVATFTETKLNNTSILDYYNSEKCIIVADRYVTSNILHQSIKTNNFKKYIKEIERLEYNLMSLPKPDKVIYLDVEPEVSMKNITKRNIDTDNSDIDIHENLEHLKDVYDKKDNIIKYMKWDKIICSSNGEMKDIERIKMEILAKVVEVFPLQDELFNKRGF